MNTPIIGGEQKDLEQLDPFMPIYVHEKMNDPNARFVMRQIREDFVKYVDHLLLERKRLACNEEVRQDKDWELLKYAFTTFAKNWPMEYSEFKDQIATIRHTRRDKAYSQSKEMQYVGALPFRFERIIKVLFPMQNVDKKFIWELVRRMKVFKVTGEGN